MDFISIVPNFKNGLYICFNITGLDISDENKMEMKYRLEHFIERGTGAKVQIKVAKKIGTKICKVELANAIDKETVILIIFLYKLHINHGQIEVRESKKQWEWYKVIEDRKKKKRKKTTR